MDTRSNVTSGKRNYGTTTEDLRFYRRRYVFRLHVTCFLRTFEIFFRKLRMRHAAGWVHIAHPTLDQNSVGAVLLSCCVLLLHHACMWYPTILRWARLILKILCSCPEKKSWLEIYSVLLGRFWWKNHGFESLLWNYPEVCSCRISLRQKLLADVASDQVCRML